MLHKQRNVLQKKVMQS